MRKNSQEQLIRKYVRGLVLEYDSMSIGAHAGTFKDIANAALDPFRVLGASAKKVAVSGKALLKVLGHTILSTVLPFYGYKYDRLFKQRNSEINKINNKYKAVYDRVYGTLTDKNTLVFAFMASPAYFLSGAVLKTVGSAAKETVEDVVGESADFVKNRHFTKLINEANEENLKRAFSAASNAAQQENEKFLQSVYEEAKSAHEQDLDQFVKNAGEAQKDLEEKISSASEEEKKKILMGLRDAVKKEFASKLEKHLENVKALFDSADVPSKPDFESLEYVSAVRKKIEDIKGLGKSE
jgi:hypothetical protein